MARPLPDLLACSRVRVKICGVTRVQDVHAAAAAGADAIGLNCYGRSPRYVGPAVLRELAAALPPFVTPTLLFVNAGADDVRAALDVVPHALLQFHGDEEERFCASFERPYLRAVPMGPEVDLLDWQRRFPTAAAFLLDAPAAGYGGSGQRFDWSRVPPVEQRRVPVVLAGGLHEHNVGAAIEAVRPAAVDVCSGVEAEVKGIKDPARMARFIAAVAAASSRS